MADVRDFQQDLLEQWDYLRASMLAYDAGRQHEAKRLAVTVRVLVYDQGGRGLLTQMGVKDQLQWTALGGGVNPNNVAPTNSLVFTRMEVTNDGAATSYSPLDQDYVQIPGMTKLVAFDEWWKSPVIKTAGGDTYNREQLVTMLANRDGGAHVGRLKPNEGRLAANEGLGWVVHFGGQEIPVLDSPVPASLRTIAQELHLTLANQLEVLGLPDDYESILNRL